MCGKELNALYRPEPYRSYWSTWRDLLQLGNGEAIVTSKLITSTELVCRNVKWSKSAPDHLIKLNLHRLRLRSPYFSDAYINVMWEYLNQIVYITTNQKWLHKYRHWIYKLKKITGNSLELLFIIKYLFRFFLPQDY